MFKFNEFSGSQKRLLIVVVGLMIGFYFCFWIGTNTNKTETRRILNENAYISVKTTGYKWFACSTDDWSHTGFSAINSNGNKIKGVVCCGLIFKNCTIRYK